MDSEETSGLSLRDYIAVVRRQKWIIIVLAVGLALAGYLYANSKPKLYAASARLMYDPPIRTSTSLYSQSGDPASVALELQNVVTLPGNPSVQEKAGALLGTTKTGYSISATVVAPDSTAAGGYSNVASVTATSPSPKVAAAAANAYAQAIIEWRKANQVAQIQQAEKAVQSKIDQFKGATNSPDYLILAQRLNDLQLMEATANGDFRVIVPAYPPSVPFSPRPTRTAMLGFGLGLVLGLAIAFLREQFDTRVRSYREISETLQLPTVGRLPRVRSANLKRGPLVVISDPEGAAAEALRVIRSNLEFFSIDDDIRSLAVVSAHKGEGKSLTVANLAVTMAMAGKKVVLIDGDLRRPRLHQAFELDNDVGLSTVVSGQTELADALQPYYPAGLLSDSGNGSQRSSSAESAAARLYVLTAGPVPPNPGEIVASRRFEAILKELHDSTVDFVLLDTPAFGSVGDAAAVAARVDGLVLVVNVENATRPDLEEARDFLRPLPCRKLGIIAVSENFTGRDYYYYRS